MEELYADAIEIYDRAREEVLIPRKDGSMQKYAAVRFKQQIDKAHEDGTLITTVARIIRKPTLGFGHLEAAGRPGSHAREPRPRHRQGVPPVLQQDDCGHGARADGAVPPRLSRTSENLRSERAQWTSSAVGRVPLR